MSSSRFPNMDLSTGLMFHSNSTTCETMFVESEWTHSSGNWAWTHSDANFLSEEPSMDYPPVMSTSTPNASPVDFPGTPTSETWERIQRISRFLDWVSLEAKRQSCRDHGQPAPVPQIDRVVLTARDPDVQFPTKTNTQSKRRARRSDGNNNADKKDRKIQNALHKKMNGQGHGAAQHFPRRKQSEKVLTPLISIPPPSFPFRPKVTVLPQNSFGPSGKKALFQDWFPNLSEPPPNMR